MNDQHIQTDFDTFADIYDAEYADYHATIGDIDFYRRTMESPSTRVLDLGCGTGRIAIELARTGANVTGIDIAPKMIAIAETKRRALESNVRERLQFVVADMRSFAFAEKFTFAYAGFRSFMLLLSAEDQEQSLRRIHQHLQPDGRLIITMFVPSFAKRVQYTTEAAEQFRFCRRFSHPNGASIIEEFERKWCDDFQQIWEHALKHVTLESGNEPVKTTERMLTIRWTSRFEFYHLARLCGYAVEYLYGDYFSTPYDSTSKEMVWVLRR